MSIKSEENMLSTKRKKYIILILLLIGIGIVWLPWVYSKEEKPQETLRMDKESFPLLTIEEFIKRAVENDTEFEQILINELALQYQKSILLPSADLVLGVKGQYDFILDQEREEPNATISLSKLFPKIGTNIAADYSTSPSLSARKNTSDIDIYLSQPIAENAFGRDTRLHDRIIGIEIEVAKHQIIEAYEDYLATLITAYCDWYEAYENVLIGESSYKENQKLLDNMIERHKSKIALPIDVNKTRLQVLAKKESLITLYEEYDRTFNIIKTAIRYEGDEGLRPLRPTLYEDVSISFNNDFALFQERSRTFSILRLLEQKSSLDVKRSADDLLPSLNLLVGYKLSGDEMNFEGGDGILYTGFSFSFPIPDEVDRAEYNVSKIEEEKAQLTTNNVYYQLYKDLGNLALRIQREEKLLALADEKIKLSAAVLEDETKNYTFGKVTLNDYIEAVNRFDNNRFNEISHIATLKRLKIEWLRLNDQLVARAQVSKKYQWNDN